MNKSLIILAILVVLGVSTYLIIEFKVKKWKCTEGKCEKVIGGDYASLDKCRNGCKVKKQEYHTDKNQHRRLLADRRARATGKKNVSWAPRLVDYEKE